MVFFLSDILRKFCFVMILNDEMQYDILNYVFIGLNYMRIRIHFTLFLLKISIYSLPESFERLFS